MMPLVSYEVLEHHPDDIINAFGDYLSPTKTPIRVNDVIMLRWLDGRAAYPVRVLEVHDGTLHVMAIRQETVP